MADTTSRWEQLARMDLWPAETGSAAEVLHYIVEIVERLLPATGGASIVLYDRVADSYAISVSTVPGQTDALASTRVRDRRGATRTIIEGAPWVAVGRLADDPFGANPMLSEYGLNAYLGVPIFDPLGNVVGVLYALDRDERIHTEDDIAFLGAVGRRAGAVIHHADGVRALDVALQRTRTLLTIATTIRTTEPIDQTVRVALRQLEQSLGASPSWAIPSRAGIDVLHGPISTRDAPDLPPILMDLAERRTHRSEPEAVQVALRELTGNDGVFVAELVSGPQVLAALAITRALPFHDDERALLYGVTDQLAVAVASAVRLRTIERSNAELENFAAAISHDLRNPLASVIGFVDLLATEVGDQLPRNAQDWLDRVNRAAARMSGMIEALLAHSRLRGAELHLERVDLARLVGELVGSLGDLIRDAEAEIEMGELPDVVTDRQALSIIVQNLLGNALRYHQPDEPPYVRVHATLHSTSWELEVEDRGIGVPEDLRERIFDVFNRGLLSHDAEGHGIGLSTSRSLAHSLGGSLSVTGGTVGGSVFTLALPLRELDDAGRTDAGRDAAAQAAVEGFHDGRRAS